MRRTTAILLAAGVFVLTGCSGTGNDAQTNEQYQAGVGANVRTGPIQIFNALAVDNGHGSATFSAAILNQSPTKATLKSAKAVLADGTKVAVTTQPATLASGKILNVGKKASISLQGKKLAAGDYVTVTLTFDEGRTVTVDAPVVARNADYKSVAR